MRPKYLESETTAEITYLYILAVKVINLLKNTLKGGVDSPLL